MIYVIGFNGQLGRSLCDLNEEIRQQNVELLPLVIKSEDVVINCAAMTDHNQCNQNSQAAWDVNCGLVMKLADICRTFDTHLIHISTDYVFNNKPPYVIATEKTEPNPVEGNIYAHTKWHGEEFLRRSSFNKWTIVRTSWLMSPYKPTEYLSLPKCWVQVGCPTWAPDLAQALMTLANDWSKPTGILHYCGPSMSRREMAELYTGKKPQPIDCPKDRPQGSIMKLSTYWNRKPMSPEEIINEYNKTFPYKK